MQRLLLGIARNAVRVYYRVQRLGGAIPATGPVLLVGNHPNGLVDPVLLAGTTTRPVRFLGKAPLFEMPMLGAVMRGLHALPVYRQQDGADTTANTRTFEAVFSALRQGELVCLFPEGRSHDEPTLTKLKTGAARMALGAEASRDWGLGVRIVPVGLVYRSKPSFRSRVAVWTGHPIEIADLRGLHAADERKAVAQLTGRIAEGLRAVTLELERWEDLPLLELAERILFSEREGRLERLQAFARALRKLRETEAGRVERLGLRISLFRDRLARLGLEPHDFARKLELDYRPGLVLRFALRNLAVLLAGLPLAALGAAIWFVPHRLAGALPKRFASLDILATARILAGALFFPVWLLALALLAWHYLGAPWTAVLVLASPFLGLLALGFRDWRLGVRSEVRAFLRMASRERLRALLLRERDELAGQLEELRARL